MGERKQLACVKGPEGRFLFKLERFTEARPLAGRGTGVVGGVGSFPLKPLGATEDGKPRPHSLVLL